MAVEALAALAAAVKPMKPSLAICFFMLLSLGCNYTPGESFVPQKVSIDDPKIQPLIKAAIFFDRERYGFTSIPDQADVRWESRPTEKYDAMLHIYAKTSRTIAFKKTDNGFSWTGEQEIFEGPKEYETPDGTFNESIALTYELETISGYPTNQLNISYFGKDERLDNKNNLSIDDIKPILKEWGY